MPHSVPRLLQQQPRPLFAREQLQQQQSGATDFQPPKAEPRIFWDRNMPLSSTTIAAFATDGRITPDFIDRIFQYLQDQGFETP